MNTNGNNGVLLISTKQSQTEMIKTGGVIMPSPRVNRTRVESSCKYIVACEESQGNAFLIGEIDRVLWVNGQCVIKIAAYALLDKPGIWQEFQTKAGFAYLNNPSQMHLYVGRHKMKSIYNSIYNGNGHTNGNGNGNPVRVSGGVAATATDEVKRSAIVTYPKQKIEDAKKLFADSIEFADKPVTPQFGRIAELRKELAELEASRKAMLHQLIDAMSDVETDEAIRLLASFIK